MITVGLALVAVGLWIHAVDPFVLAAGGAATNPATSSAASTTGGTDAAHSLRLLVHGTLLLSFVLICGLLVVGFFATLREWVRYRSMRRTRDRERKTRYVDAWKLAGERMNVTPQEGPGAPPDAPE